jgi:hypothetical protein
MSDPYVYLRGLDGVEVRRFEPTGRPLVIIQAKESKDDAELGKLARGFETRALSGGGPCGFDMLFLPSRITYEVVGARETTGPKIVEAPPDEAPADPWVSRRLPL